MISHWVFPKIGVSHNGWFIMEKPPKQMDDLGGNTHYFRKHPHHEEVNLLNQFFIKATPPPEESVGGTAEPVLSWHVCGHDAWFESIRWPNLPNWRILWDFSGGQHPKGYIHAHNYRLVTWGASGVKSIIRWWKVNDIYNEAWKITWWFRVYVADEILPGYAGIIS